MNPEMIQPWVGAALLWAPKLLWGLLTFFVGYVVSNWSHGFTLRTVEQRGLDKALGQFVAQLVRWTVLGATIIAALGTVGIQTTSLVAVFASAGLAVGMALQGSLSNFASGVLILIFRPFNIGDVITAAGHTGAVMEIGIFATILHTPDGLKLILPNSAVTGGTIVNITTLGTRRADVPVGVAYGEDPAKVMAILEAAAKSCPSVLAEPGVAVAFVGLGDSSIDFNVMGWTESPNYLAALHEIRTACYNALNAEGVDIPYPQVVLHKAEA